MSLEPADELLTIRNIGPKTISWLHAVGIHTQADLEDLGAVEAYKRLKTAFPDKVSLNALYGLQGAILNMPWNALPPDMKAELITQVKETRG
jgi:DNA transformation protein